MATRLLSAALVLCASAVGLTGTAHATEDGSPGMTRVESGDARADPIKRVPCRREDKFLELWKASNEWLCFANAGGLPVEIFGVNYYNSGNNRGYFKYKVASDPSEYQIKFEKGDSKWVHGESRLAVTVTFIAIY